MLCCKFDLPGVFGWKIKGIGKGAELVQELKQIMQLAEIPEEPTEITVMPRSYYDSLPEKERSELQISYSRKAVRLFHNSRLNTWLLVIPENILSDRKIRTVLLWLVMKPFYLHCFSNGGLPVHAASASLNGHGIIIAASGDTGKTTTVRRLPYPWQELGDDNALLLPEGNKFRLYPLPTWSEFIYGSNTSASWDIKKGTDLAGIFFLKQSEQDSAEKLSVSKAMISLYNSSMEVAGDLKRDIRGELNRKIFATAADITSEIPVFSLYATQTGKVWESIEQQLEITSKAGGMIS
jgi:SynChlorMet cassette protein ScmC